MKKTATHPEYESKSPIRIVLADDNDIVRSSLKLFIKSTPELQLVGEAADGIEAIAVCTLQKPDIILMDITMPVVDGIEATRIIRRRFPKMSILALSSFSDNGKIKRIMHYGADSHIPKQISADELIKSIQKLVGEHITSDRESI